MKAPGRAFDESYPYLMLFSGDPFPDIHRHSLAVEPMTCPPNAFRTGNCFAGRAQPQLPAGFLLRVAAFADGSGAAGARSIDTRRPAVKRYTPGQGPLR